MRVLVLSDSHGAAGNILSAVEAQNEVRHIFFLGDGLTDLETVEPLFKNKIIHKVAGNCDYAAFGPSTGLEVINSTKIFYTHGHMDFVKGGLSALKTRSAAAAADIVLFGHTHMPCVEYENGVYYVNPGSVGHSRSGKNTYAVIDIEKNGIMPVIINI